MERGNDCAVRDRKFPLSKGIYRNVVAQLGAHLFQLVSRQVIDGDQTPLTVSVRNCDAVDRGGITLSLCLALLGALCRGFRDVQSGSDGSGANGYNTKNLSNGPKCHDLLRGAQLSYSWLGAHFVRLEPSRTSCESAPALFLPVKPSASWSAIDHNLGSKTGNLIWIKNLEVAKSGFLLPVRRERLMCR
jgi:hypothetical protein